MWSNTTVKHSLGMSDLLLSILILMLRLEDSLDEYTGQTTMVEYRFS